MAVFDGTTGDDVWSGGAGDDQAQGWAGNDTLSGGGGNDTLAGGAGNDVVEGGDGSDILAGDVQGTQPSQWFDFLGEHDVLNGGASSDQIYAGYGDTIDGGADQDTLRLSLRAAPGAVTADFRSMTAAGGDFQIGTTTITGIETIGYLEGGPGDDLLAVADSNVYLQVSIKGGQGNDQIHGGTWGGNFDGEAGNDVIDASHAADGFMTYVMATGGDGDDRLTGSDRSMGETLFGNAGNDILTAGAGNDILSGGAGADVIDGGAGDDSASYTDATSMVVLSLFAPALSRGDAAGDTITGVERYYLSSYGDLMYGSNDADWISAGSGRDSLYGQAGDDTIYGGVDHDLLWGGLGADALHGGDGFDYARYDDATFPGMTVALFAPSLNTGAAAGDTYTGIEGLILGFFDDKGYGSNSADYVYGINGNDSLYGQGGDDFVFGGEGNDLLWGGLGADYLDGDTGFDYARYDDATFPSLTASLLDPSINTGAAQGDTYSGLEGLILGYFDDTGHGSNNADYLYGINGNDTLHGQGGNDNVYGGSGNDVLNGGLGNDYLHGDVGSDTFRFDTAPNASTNLDTIADFTSGSDKVGLENSVFTALAATGTLAAGNFRSGAGVTAAADADDHILYDTSTGALYYDADGSGSASGAIRFATIAGAPALAAADIALY